MARIRSIHPALLTDVAYMALTVENPLAIALYIGLLMESDDYGLFEWKPMTIKARILPAVSAEVAPLLDALVQNRFVAQFAINGKSFGAIRNFCRYQRPKKPHGVHPRTEQTDEWTDAKQHRSPTGSEPVGNSDETGGENPPQMKEEGGIGRKKEEPLSLRSSAAPAAHERGLVFDRFRAAYPKQTEAGGVRRELDAILDAGRATPDELCAGAERYAKSVAGKEDRFIASPVKWLQDERWTDGISRGDVALPIIDRDSDEGRAWDAYSLATKGKPLFWTNNRATVRTRYPPRLEQVA